MHGDSEIKLKILEELGNVINKDCNSNLRFAQFMYNLFTEYSINFYTEDKKFLEILKKIDIDKNKS